MQLKNLGLVSTAIKSIGKGATDINAVANAVRSLSVENTTAVLASTNLTNTQKQEILVSKGVAESKAEEIIATQSLTAANTTATASTGALTGATTSLKAAFEGLKATMMAHPILLIITLVTTAIAGITQLSSKFKEAKADSRQRAIEASNSASSLSSEITELTASYLELSKAVGTDQAAKESLISTQDDLIEKLGLEQREIDKLINKYGSLDAAIKMAASEELEDAELDLRGGLNAREEELIDAAKTSFLTGENMNFLSGSASLLYGTSDWKEYDKDEVSSILKELEKEGYFAGEGAYSTRALPWGFEFKLSKEGYDLSTVEGIINAHERLGEMLKLVSDYAGSDNVVYETLYNQYSRVTDAVENYSSAITDLNTNLAEQYMLTELARSPIPNTAEEFNTFKQSVVEAALSSGEFVGSQQDVEAAVDNVLRKQSQFKDFYAKLTDAVGSATFFGKSFSSLLTDGFKEEISSYTESVETLKDALNSIRDGSFSDSDLVELIDTFPELASETDNLDYAITTLISTLGANISSELDDQIDNMATDKDVKALEAYKKALLGIADTTEVVEESVDDLVSALEDLNDIFNKVQEGTDLSTFEMWELVESYPELITAIRETANGYQIEEEALRSLIKAKAENLRMDAVTASDTRLNARSVLVANAGTEKTANSVDELFAEYYEKNGANISSWEEFLDARAEKYNLGSNYKNAKHIDGYKEYVESVIADNSLNSVLNSLIDDMADPDSIKTGESKSVERFEKIQSQYEREINDLDYLVNTYNNEIDKIEATGQNGAEKYYELLKGVEGNKIDVLTGQRDELRDAFNDAIASGEIEKGTDEWNSMQDAINDVKEQIQDAELAILDYNNTLRSLDWEWFDYQQEQIENLIEEADFLIDILDNSDLYDDKGKLTDDGMAVMGLHGSNYNVYLHRAEQYADEIAKIEKDLAENGYDKELAERKEDLLDLQRQMITSAEDEKQAVIDLVKEGYDIELEALENLIDKYVDALDSAKDLYDYQQKINDATSEISVLQKQLVAYEGDNSEETKMKVQQLKVELESAQKDLEETEYDKYIDDQKKLLDDLKLDYKAVIDERLDNIDYLFNIQIDEINARADDIRGAIEGAGDEVGIAVSDGIKEIWGGDGNISAVLSGYNNGFTTKLTTISGVLDKIAGKIDDLKNATPPVVEVDVGEDVTASNNSTNIGGVGGSTTVAGKIKDMAPLTITKPEAEPKKTEKAATNTETAKLLQIDKTNSVWTTYQDAVKAGYSGIHTPDSFKNDATALKEYKTYDKYLKGMYDEYIGFVEQESYNPMNESSVTGRLSIDQPNKEFSNRLYRSTIKMDAAGNTYLPGISQDGDRDVWVKEGEGYTISAEEKNGKTVYKVDYLSNRPLYKFANGGFADYTGLAWLDGTKQKPEAVLDAKDTKNFVSLRDTLRKFMNEEVTLAKPTYPFTNFEPISYNPVISDFSEQVSKIIAATNDSVQSMDYDQEINIEIHIDKVDDYDDMMTKIQKDPKFEKLVQAMTFGKSIGRPNLSKYNVSWNK